MRRSTPRHPAYGDHDHPADGCPSCDAAWDGSEWLAAEMRRRALAMRLLGLTDIADVYDGVAADGERP